jgi:hypothetical protein
LPVWRTRLGSCLSDQNTAYLGIGRVVNCVDRRALLGATSDRVRLCLMVVLLNELVCSPAPPCVLFFILTSGKRLLARVTGFVSKG